MRAFLTSLLLVFLAACTAGPDTDALKADVHERLELALPAGFAEVESLHRRGSQVDTKSPDGESRRIVYFDVSLKLNRDIDFGAWNAPGIAGLISALGAGPKGVEGIITGGNKAGDVITAHGTARYRQNGDAWELVVPAGYLPPVAPGVVTGQNEGAGAILSTIRKVVDAFPRNTSPAEYAAIEEELTAAHASIRARLARVSDGYAIAAGAEHGQYLRVARALFGDRDSRVVPLITRGGEENLRLLRAGKVSLIVAQGDAALDAYQGSGPFSNDGPHASLRAIASLYPEPMHVLVRAADGPESVAGLRGKRIAVGETGAASRTTALRVLEAHGLRPEDIDARALSISAALLALQNNEVDAVLQVIGTPADSVRDAQKDMRLKLLPLSNEAIANLSGARAGYFPYTIVRGTYAGQEQDVKTIATAALLLTGTTLSDAEIGSLIQRVFEPGRDYTALGSAQGAQISLATSSVGLPVPQHIAATRALERLSAK